MSTDPLVTLHGPAMGTRWTARLPRGQSPGLTGLLQATLDAVERQTTTWRADSDLMRLNAAPPGIWVEVGADLLAVLGIAAEIAAASGGAFDIGVGRAIAGWGFGAARGRPDPALIRATMGRPLRAAVECDAALGRARRLNEEWLDLSGIAKGHAVDRMAEALRGRGIAGFLVGLDGEIRAEGARPDGSPWAIALEEPDPDRRAARGVIELGSRALATSGDYRHRFTAGDAWFAHTIDPRSGTPVRNRLAGVTVLAPDCVRADAWATALMVMGELAAPAFARQRRIEAIFLIRDEAAISEITTLAR